MTLTELRNKADAKLVEFWNALAAWQEQNRLEFDNYRQLLVTNTVVDGVDTDFEVRTPSDHTPLAVNRDFSFTSKIPFSISVNCWGTEPSRGFEATAIVELLDGRKFKRSRSLTDTRERVRDVVTEVDGIVTEWGDWYLSGTDPVIETSNWEEIVNEEL